MKATCLLIAVVALVVLSRSPLSSAEEKRRLELDSTTKTAIVEAALKFGISAFGDNGKTKVVISHVGDITYEEEDGTIRASIGFRRPDMEPINQYLNCHFTFEIKSGDRSSSDETPFKLASYGCVL